MISGKQCINKKLYERDGKHQCESNRKFEVEEYNERTINLI